MNHRRLSSIDECEHPTNDPERHTRTAFHMESVFIEPSSIDHNRIDLFICEVFEGLKYDIRIAL